MSLATDLAAVPAAPGVYLWRDADGVVLYVGKALSLRDRVSSYVVRGRDGIPRAAAGIPYARTRALVARVLAGGSLQVTETEDEDAALGLESALIKRHSPPYNVRLREGAALPYLHLTRDEFPRLAVLREPPGQESDLVLGPYRTARSAEATLAILHRIAPLRPCAGRRPGRPGALPCLDHELGRCPAAPCVQRSGLADYDVIVQHMRWLMQGEDARVADDLHRLMAQAAAAQDFEAAAQLRDRRAAMVRLGDAERTPPVSAGECVAIAVVRGGEGAFAHRLVQAAGRVNDRGAVAMEGALSDDDVELHLQALLAFHPDGQGLDGEVVADLDESGRTRLARALAEVCGRTVTVASPARGERRRLFLLAQRNARRERDNTVDEAATGLDELAAALGMDSGGARALGRIECMDISNLQGREAVAAIVVFRDGHEDPALHRVIALEGEGPDDYAWLAEAARARLDPDGAWADQPLADVVVVDGGPGQLQAVRAVYQEVAQTNPAVARVRLISLAKRHEEVFLPGVSEPLRLAPGDPARLLLQAVRDATHRTAIGAHRTRRTRSLVRTPLDDVAGVGPARRRALVERFGSAEAACAASVEDLVAVPGISPALAARIRSARPVAR